ncbi:hypothetical protein PVAND_016508 [Polypedilum vanderplanki]|uniref:MD-2-related lipid-recognition domain-containing protein n=1 Tax=Polypedilum vanderplanki TaxID=319348 RepID=A0A9J6BGE1_POLVA|nr:hypothetical protein PVAND_016508 [Polypedilum vanderplanki]
MGKILIFFILLFQIFYSYCHIDFVQIESCSSSNITLSFEECEIKNNKVNVAVLFWRPVTKIFVKVKLFKEVNSEFREIFKVPRFEWCSVLDGTSKTNSFVRSFLNSFKDRYPKAVRKCPLTGRSEMMNVTIEKKLTMMFPSGLYRFTMKSSDDLDQRGAFFSILTKIESDYA